MICNMRPITGLGAVAAFGLALALSNGTPKPKAILVDDPWDDVG